MNKLLRTERRTRHRAFTLIEVIGTLSVLLAIAVSGAGILTTVTKIGLRNRQANQARADIVRLADSFRSDVHAARSATIASDGQSVDLSMGGALIRYQSDLQSPAVLRMQVESGSSRPVDSFSLTEDCQPAFESDDRGLILRLTTPQAGRPWVIRAVRHD